MKPTRRTMIEYNGEIYVTAAGIAKRFNISWETCQRNVLPHLHACTLPGRRRTFYQLSEIEEFAAVRVERKPVTFVAERTSVAKLPVRSATL